ncbi:hypothetical protein CUMW_279860, partial [Citrus unshiu]
RVAGKSPLLGEPVPPGSSGDFYSGLWYGLKDASHSWGPPQDTS